MRARSGRSYLSGMTTTASKTTAPSRAWLRTFALVYDPFLWLGEIAGLRSRRSALLSNARGRVVDAPAECLPFPDASVDTVVSTLVLCTVPDPERTLREIARVLRADGQLLFIEHVRAKSRLLAACQDYLFLPWRRFAAGCCCNRPTAELMRACGFDVAAEDFAWRGMPAIVRPLVVGRASR